jgi:trehalose/maltose hydrolase-like predicted phosphorylase
MAFRMSAQSDCAQSWSLFKEALKADLQDTQGEATREGIHLGAMAGTADMVLRRYAPTNSSVSSWPGRSSRW